MHERMNVVALKACAGYDDAAVQTAIDEIFALCGGVEAFVKSGDRVLIKLNLLMKRTPEQATTTHPAVAKAIVRALQRTGATVILADSPGGPYTRGHLRGIYDACGISAGTCTPVP